MNTANITDQELNSLPLGSENGSSSPSVNLVNISDVDVKSVLTDPSSGVDILSKFSKISLFTLLVIQFILGLWFANMNFENYSPFDGSFWIVWIFWLLATAGTFLIVVMAHIRSQQYEQRLSKLNSDMVSLVSENEILNSQLNLVEKLSAKKTNDEKNELAANAISRKSFVDVISHEIEASRRTEIPMCLLVLEPDQFYQNNDDILRLAIALKKRLRGSDRLAFLSDNQIGILLHNTTAEDAQPVCETWVIWLRVQLNLSVKAGLSEAIPDRDTTETLIQRAIVALKRARASTGDHFIVTPVNNN